MVTYAIKAKVEGKGNFSWGGMLGAGTGDVNKGRGIFRSEDGLRGFRIDPDSLAGKHWPNVPYAHFDIFDDAEKYLANNHVPLTEP
ncbi:hypothetical protein GCM10009827_077350 [Dactylosporangium maewongense]|uniref:Uncharacterized protein n=1 Tax=Dactylosporangium maewongense TaxID=634393 RepID=A0ABP4MMX4_9ACTN